MKHRILYKARLLSRTGLPCGFYKLHGKLLYEPFCESVFLTVVGEALLRVILQKYILARKSKFFTTVVFGFLRFET